MGLIEDWKQYKRELVNWKTAEEIVQNKVSRNRDGKYKREVKSTGYKVKKAQHENSSQSSGRRGDRE